MNHDSSAETDSRRRRRSRAIRRFHSAAPGSPRSPLVNMVIMTALVAVIVVVVYALMVSPVGHVRSDVVDFSQVAEEVQELSTLKSHMRFVVVVREEGGNIVVRKLAEQAEYIGMDNVGSVLFQDPTMIVELHGVATYGMELRDLPSRIEQTDSAVVIDLPDAEVLDVKLVAADTRIVATMKGLFRSSSRELLLEANRRGEGFVLEFARGDTAMMTLAAHRARDLLALIVERSGRRAEFH